MSDADAGATSVSERGASERGAGAQLVLVGVNHTSAPVSLRERLAISAERLPEATRSLARVPGVRESLILSTCNRVELLTVQGGGGSGPAEAPSLLAFLSDSLAVPAAAIAPHLYELREREAVRHLFRVASSLDSMVVGEPQILGQVKEAYTVAREVGAIGGQAGSPGVPPTLDRLLQSAFTAAKRVRTETAIGASSVSIASVAVDLARKIFGSLADKQVLLVGAGKMSELALRHLVAQGASQVMIANRTAERAERIARAFAGPGIKTEVVAFDGLHAQAPRADIVITSTGAPQPLFSRTNGQGFLQRRRGRPMFFIDIAVPRDVDPRMNEVEGCFVYDIDDLQGVAAGALANRSRETAAAEAIVAAEVERYGLSVHARVAVPAIKALQAEAEQTRLAEFARAAAKLSSLDPAQLAAVEALTRSLTNKLLHPQLVKLRTDAE